MSRVARPWRVAALITEVDGSSMARCFTHYDYLEKTGRLTMLTRWQVFDADVAVFHRYWKSDTLELIKSLQRHGVRVAVDVDDDIFHLEKSNPAWHEYQQPRFRDAAKRVLKAADGVFVSTPYLCEKYAHFSDNIKVIPNAINPDLWEPARRSPRDTVTIGFAGSVSHLGDLDLLRGVFGPLLLQYPQVRLTFMGAAPDWLSQEIGPDGMRRTKQVALVPVTEFPDRLVRERFDIALAPLAANPFNEARSNLKFLEYSLAGAATVASAVGPFSDGRLPLVRVGNRSYEWIAAIRRLIEDAAFRTDLAVAAKAYIEQHHTVERSCGRVLDALSELHPDTGRVPLPSRSIGIATFTSSEPFAIIHASNSRPWRTASSGGSSGTVASFASTRARKSWPFRMASTSGRLSVQPTISRMWPSLAIMPSMPRAASASAFAEKYPVMRS